MLLFESASIIEDGAGASIAGRKAPATTFTPEHQQSVLKNALTVPIGDIMLGFKSGNSATLVPVRRGVW